MTDEIKTKIWMALGAASMCWEPRPDGQFCSERATVFGQDLIDCIETDLPNAIDTLSRHLLNDPEYYRAFQANIAVQFVDEYHKEFGNLGIEKIHEIANNSAKNFLDLLTSFTEIRNIDVQERKVLIEKYI